jgi:hypothetical protein
MRTEGFLAIAFAVLLGACGTPATEVMNLPAADEAGSTTVVTLHGDDPPTVEIYRSTSPGAISVTPCWLNARVILWDLPDFNPFGHRICFMGSGTANLANFARAAERPGRTRSTAGNRSATMAVS